MIHCLHSRKIFMAFCSLFSLYILGAQNTEPVLPETDASLIYIEAEEAVSTNFNTTANLNYGASGSKTLQLNTQAYLQPGSLYYSEWVFYVEEDGNYNLWYSGTPPGPRGDLIPSYTSPFRISLDGIILKECFREDILVGDTYTPTFYWVKAGQMWMTRGTHRIKFEVIAPRLSDGKFYFFIDNLIMINSLTEETGGPEDSEHEFLPSMPMVEEVTPPFQDVSVYQSILENDPEDVDAALELARIFTFQGDHISALSTLRQILPFDVENQDILNLTAKNRIWKGDLIQSLSVYKQALEYDPMQESIWAEAGKVAGWAGQYDQSIDFFESGLEYFPDSLSLKINLALVYYWKSDPLKADEILTMAQESVSTEPEKLLEMGELLEVNGYPDKARNVFKNGRGLFPDHLNFYFREIDLYMKNRELGDPEVIYSLIESTFTESEELSKAVSLYREKQGMKQLVIDEYTDKIRQEPDNLSLREALVQALFWNGMKRQAVEEYRNILINRTYHKLSDLEKEGLNILEMIDNLFSIVPVMLPYPARALKLRNSIRNGRSAWSNAQRAVERKPEDEGLKEILEQKSEALGAVIDEAELFLGDYDFLISTISVWRDEAEAVFSEEDDDSKDFSMLIKDLAWKWDREFLIEELMDATEREKEISPWVLGKVQQYFGNYEEAEQGFLKRMGKTAFNQSIFGLYETYLWSGNIIKRDQIYSEYGDSIDLYSGYSSAVETMDDEMIPMEGGGSGYFSGDEDEIDRLNTLLGAIQLVPMGIQAGRQEIEKLTEDLRTVMENRLERSFFFITQETSALRFQLGDYLLEMGDNRAASRQFEQVLLVDPWNITATYKLGIVRQRYLDWSGAMKNYRKVFYQNPNFENAVAYYNQLGKAHPDTMDFMFVTELDNSILALKGTGIYSNDINTWMGFDLEYNFRTEHLYRTFSGKDNTSYLTQEMMLKLPLRLPLLGLEIVPSAGGILWSTYFGQDVYYPDEYKVPVSDFLDTVFARPEFGVAGSWEGGPFSFYGGWEWFVLQESIHPDREVIEGNRFSAEFSTYFEYPDMKRLSLVSTRTYGELRLLNDTNFIGQAVQEGWVRFQLSRNPGIEIRGNLGVSYEDSKSVSGGNYYAPVEILEAKGGVQGVLNLHSPDYSNSFELSLWGSAGGFWDHVLSGEDRNFALKTEGLLSLYFTRNSNSSFYTTLNGSGSFIDGDFSNSGYWQFAFTLGFRSRMPSLLTE